MTGLLHIAIFLCGVIATIAAIAIYYYISDCIEASREEKAREALEEMYNPITMTFDPSKCERWDIEGKKIK